MGMYNWILLKKLQKFGNPDWNWAKSQTATESKLRGIREN